MNKEENYKIQVDILNQYTIKEDLKEGDIFHLYGKEEAYPMGYFDSRWFDLWIFNTKTKEKRLIEDRDEVTFGERANVMYSRIFIDGSTLIKLSCPVSFEVFQSVRVG